MSDILEIEIDTPEPGFFKALQDPEGFLPFLSKAMANILTTYQALSEMYAPESDANRPGRVDKDGNPVGYYERGRGWWYPLVTHNTMSMGEELPVVGPHPKGPKTLKSMKLLANGISRVSGYKLVPNSEKMHDQWSWEVNVLNNEVVGELKNTASYSPNVQGMEQDPLHAARGWSTVMASWEDELVQNAVTDETMMAIDTYYLYGAG